MNREIDYEEGISMTNEFALPYELSKRAIQMIHALHRESHTYGECDCDMSERQNNWTLWETAHHFDRETIEAAAGDPGDVDAILQLRDWFGLPPLG